MSGFKHDATDDLVLHRDLRRAAGAPIPVDLTAELEQRGIFEPFPDDSDEGDDQ